MNSNKKYFTKTLLSWNKRDNKRKMPWKGETDPYKIWLSEIILQQTRVEQGWDYYNRFIDAYPTVGKLAKAPENEVFKLWEGLGYYTRCKNLIETARFISKEKKGRFPDIYEEILALKGVGPYTAAAITSFAFNLPHAVVDGNVFRILSRFFGINEPIDSTRGKKTFEVIANELLDKKTPGIYNQAIMDFGAVICKPKNPVCNTCMLKTRCVARLQGITDKLPVKNAKITRKSRCLYYFIIEHNNKFYVRKRGAGDIWENLYEFILLETTNMMTVDKIKRSPEFKEMMGKNKIEINAVSKLYRQQLTHQTIQGRFFQLKAKNKMSLKPYKAVTAKELKKLPFPRFITGYLTENEVKAFER
ncbi:MAG: A/G-specific adenine glycosylase [Ferruginibacter sp.]